MSKSKPVTAWSYSRYALHQMCPRKFKFKNIDKIPEPQGPAAERGTSVHKEAEDYVNLSRDTRHKTALPTSLLKFKEQFLNVITKTSFTCVEQNWGFTKGFGSTCDWFDWARIWCRIKVDLCFIVPKEPRTMAVIDHKTGKVRNEEYEGQLELSAIGAMEKFKDVDRVIAENWYLDHGPEYNQVKVYTRDELEKLELKWSKKVRPLLNDEKFPAKPGGYCRFCYQAKSKGGRCEFG